MPLHTESPVGADGRMTLGVKLVPLLLCLQRGLIHLQQLDPRSHVSSPRPFLAIFLTKKDCQKKKIFPFHVYRDRTDLSVWSPQDGHNDVS
jgi:hypothetical protein